MKRKRFIPSVPLGHTDANNFLRSFQYCRFDDAMRLYHDCRRTWRPPYLKPINWLIKRRGVRNQYWSAFSNDKPGSVSVGSRLWYGKNMLHRPWG